jgi:hypothetical protein
MKDRLQPRSQRPVALTEDRPDVTVGGTVSPKDPRTLTFVERVAALLVLYTVAVDAVEFAFLTGLLAPTEAVKLGVDKNAAEVFDELSSALTTYAPYIHAMRVKGYGPRRGHFAVRFLRQVAPSLDAHATRDQSAKVASRQAARAIEPMGDAYHQHLRALSNLLGHDPEALDRLDAKAAADHSAEEKIEALNRLVEEITRARETVPVSLLDDAGLSADVLDALTASARAARDARTSLRQEIASRQLVRGDLVPHVGRMVFELRHLLGAVKESRRTDPTLPTFRSKFVHRRAKPTRAPEPATPLTPAEPPATPK